MKKTLLGLLLLVLLAAITYVQYQRSTERRAEAWAEGHQAGTQDAAADSVMVDSLLEVIETGRSYLTELQDCYETAETEQDSLHRTAVDSLANLIEEQSAEITRLQGLLSEINEKAEASRSEDSSAQAVNAEILRSYRLAVAKLPSDLSPYEHRIAVKEVRTETAQKFKITVDRLNQLREENNLDY